jgi:hypothetical protein
LSASGGLNQNPNFEIASGIWCFVFSGENRDCRVSCPAHNAKLQNANNSQIVLDGEPAVV